MSKKDRQFWESAKKNNGTFNMYFDKLTEYAVSSFKWTGLPETIDARFLELILFSQGQAVFFYDEELGYLTLQCTIGGKLNVYRIPTTRRAYASNGYNKSLDEKDSVIIYNNLLHKPSFYDNEMFAIRLAELDRIIDVNAKAQKTPIMLQGNEASRLSLKNLYMKYDGNEPFIFASNNLDPNSIKVLNTGAPYVCDRIYTLKTQIWNEALTYNGISNVNVTKKERLVTSEVDRIQGGTYMSRRSKLLARQYACEQINQMFGLNVWCEWEENIIDDDFNNSISGEGDIE